MWPERIVHQAQCDEAQCGCGEARLQGRGRTVASLAAGRRAHRDDGLCAGGMENVRRGPSATEMDESWVETIGSINEMVRIRIDTFASILKIGMAVAGNRIETTWVKFWDGVGKNKVIKL